MAGRLGQDVAELAARGDARLNHKWRGDGTEIGTDEGKLYLASVMDAASRRIIGFTLSEHHDAAAAYGAVAMAVTVRSGQVPGVIMHTGQGSQGGFNWSSQHLDRWRCGDGTMRERQRAVQSVSGADAVAGAADGGLARGSGAVLGGDRPGCEFGGARLPGSACRRRSGPGGSVTLAA